VKADRDDLIHIARAIKEAKKLNGTLTDMARDAASRDIMKRAATANNELLENLYAIILSFTGPLNPDNHTQYVAVPGDTAAGFQVVDQLLKGIANGKGSR
jgi:hypothetical protein